MRNWVRVLAVVLILISAFAATLWTQAQEDTGEMVRCSADVIANLYTAERFFGFSSVHEQMMQGDMTTVDVSQIDKGQFTPLFDAMMGMSSADMMSSMTAEQMTAVGDMMMMDEASMMESMMSSMPAGMDISGMSTLTIATVEDEAPECATLRADLTRFFTAVAFQDLTMAGAGTTDGAGTTTTSDSMEKVNLSANLAGANEVPGPGDDDATGTSFVTLDFTNGQVCYDVTVENITLPAAAAHIHRGAEGESGPPVVTLDKAPDDSGTATGCVLTDANLMTEIGDNPAGFYVNVHNADFPDGAARGQLSR
jgi:hypothetical protein